MDEATRQQLGDLFVRWFVPRVGPARVVNLEVESPQTARPLHVREVSEHAAVLGTVLRWNGRNTWEEIQAMATDFTSVDSILFMPPVWQTPKGAMLIDGCHRACALYLSDPASVQLDPLLVQWREGLPDLACVLSLP